MSERVIYEDNPKRTELDEKLEMLFLKYPFLIEDYVDSMWVLHTLKDGQVAERATKIKDFIEKMALNQNGEGESHR